MLLAYLLSAGKWTKGRKW